MLILDYNEQIAQTMTLQANSTSMQMEQNNVQMLQKPSLSANRSHDRAEVSQRSPLKI